MIKFTGLSQYNNMAEFIYFNSRDELLRINMGCIVYVEADGNYTRIILENGQTLMVGANLVKMEKALVASLGEKAGKFVRVGKRFIVNMSDILVINTLKQELVLSNQKTFSYTLSISKEALRVLKNLLFTSKAKKNQKQE